MKSDKNNKVKVKKKISVGNILEKTANLPILIE